MPKPWILPSSYSQALAFTNLNLVIHCLLQPLLLSFYLPSVQNPYFAHCHPFSGTDKVFFCSILMANLSCFQRS